MGEVHRLPLRQLVLVDERGAGLRATWHAEHELVVLSIWRGDACVATFRLPIADVSALAAFLSTVSAEWAADVVAGRRAAPAAPVISAGDG